MEQTHKLHNVLNEHFETSAFADYELIGTPKPFKYNGKEYNDYVEFLKDYEQEKQKQKKETIDQDEEFDWNVFDYDEDEEFDYDEENYDEDEEFYYDEDGKQKKINNLKYIARQWIFCHNIFKKNLQLKPNLMQKNILYNWTENNKKTENINYDSSIDYICQEPTHPIDRNRYGWKCLCGTCFGYGDTTIGSPLIIKHKQSGKYLCVGNVCYKKFNPDDLHLDKFMCSVCKKVELRTTKRIADGRCTKCYDKCCPKKKKMCSICDEVRLKGIYVEYNQCAKCFKATEFKRKIKLDIFRCKNCNERIRSGKYKGMTYFNFCKKFPYDVLKECEFIYQPEHSKLAKFCEIIPIDEN